MRVRTKKIIIVNEGNVDREYKSVQGASNAIASQIARRLEKRHNDDPVKNAFINRVYAKALRRVNPIVDAMFK